ncbi:MAG: rhodanese-related sulfurtransferase [Rhodobacterales bacterium]|nr:rhodanese-related sulfurtransferase [Rhodobacterales bacterium]
MLTVAALYHFTRLPDPAALRAPILDLCRDQGVRGTLILAPEGVNGTIAGPRAGIDRVVAHLRGLPGCAGIEVKESPAATMPFRRLRVKLRAEIVTLGQPGADPLAAVGRHVPPAEWNDLIRQPDVAVIDTRNAYEVAIGTFAGAIDPGTATFRDFPAWWQANRDRLGNRGIAMFCTGGIRCERATAWLISQGVDRVFHLQGGILNYLDQVPAADSLWQGQCFVFDERVSVGHGLVPGGLATCGACRRPLTDADRAHPAFEDGVCCPACVDDHSPADRERFRERKRQMQLAARRAEG